MAKSAGGGPEGLPQDPYVERLKPDPSQPAMRVVELVGLPGNSDRAGYQRLYLTTGLDYYAEFLTSNMVHSEAVAADQSPFPGHEATRVSVSRDATIHYIWARSPHPVDEFDLDIRLGAPAAAPALTPFYSAHACTATCTACPVGTCATCAGQNTCHAANTCQGHGTCGQATNCLQPACIFTQGNQATCAANTACQQMTCVTCPAPGNTCAATCVA